MIVVDLACDGGHRFEAWFRCAEDFEHQAGTGLVECPVCGTTVVTRTPSAPYLNSARPPAPVPAAPDPQAMARQLGAALRAMAARAEDVGDRFPEEARRIHYDQAEQRSVRGKASRDQLEALIDEGIGVLPVPPTDDDLH